jgi:putative DNA primase/helicase
MIASLRSIARALGGEIVGREVLAPGLNHSRRDRSLSVRLSPASPSGFIVFSHANDDWRACHAYVAERLGLARDAWKADRAARPRQAKPPPSDDPEAERARKIACALSLWAHGVDTRGTPVERYLASRKLALGADVAGDVIRWHVDIGAMLALFRDVRSDKPIAISRTFLDREARKLDRRFLGPVGGCAIKLDPDDAVLAGLHIGEGLETCLAARQLGLRPCWALGSKGAIGAFPVLNGVEALTIFAEPDAAKQIEACAARWHAASREVLINRAIGGKDLADVLPTAAPHEG